jgi:glycosyltransferase involved in cell wall biosynthesis
MKIVFCTDGIFPHSIGGMQRHSKLLIEELAKDIELQIWVIHPHKESVFNNERINEIKIRGINSSNNYLIECYKYSKRVYLEVVKHNNAVVYSQGLSIWYNCHLLSKRLIVNPHGLEPYQATGFKNKFISLPFKFIFNYIFKRSAFVVSLGGSLTNILRSQIFRNNIVEISNAVNLSRISVCQRKQTESCNVLFVGRFATNKGIHILVEAINKLDLLGYKHKFRFVLAGTGPLFNDFAFLEGTDNVELLGFVSDCDLQELYESADIFVLPTLFEGMPTVVLEAMSFGLPIIVTDVGATKVIVDDSNGKVIRRGSVDDLCSALLWFENLDADEKNRLKSSSIKKVTEKFNWQVVAVEHKKLFHRL